MLVDTISKVNNITFDSTDLNTYIRSLRGLSETQARVVLSSTSLDKVQKQQILNKLAETNATVSLTSAEATETLTRSLGSKEAANELLVKSGLVTEEQVLAGTTIEVTSAKIADAVATGMLTKEEGAKILTAFGLTGANIGLGTSFKLLAKSIGAAIAKMVVWLATNPFGWATIAIGAVAGLVKGYDALIGRQEKLARTKIEGLNEDISEYDAEINSLTELQNKLESAKGDKTELAKIQTELNEVIGNTPGLLNGEGEAWDTANVKIQANIDLLKQQRKEAQQNKVNASKELFDNNVYEVDWDFDVSGNQMRSVAQQYQDYVDKYNSMSDEIRETIKNIHNVDTAEDYAFKMIKTAGIDLGGGTTRIFNFDKSDWQEYWNEQVNTAYDVFEDTINSYDGAGGQNFLKNLISNMVKGGSDLSDISTAVAQVIENEDMQNAINDYWESLVNPNIDSEKALSKVKSIFDGIAAQFPELAGFFDDFYNQIATNGFNAAKSVEKNLNKTTASLPISEMEKASAAISTIGSALNELEDNGRISIKTISAIKEGIGESVSNWEDYEKVLLNAEKGSAEVNSILSDLTYATMEQQFASIGLANATEEQVAAALRDADISNYNAVAHDICSRAKETERIQSALLVATTVEEISALAAEAGQAGITGQAFYDLIIDIGILNNTYLDPSQKIAALQEIGFFANWAADQVANVSRVSSFNVDGKKGISVYDKDGKLIGVDLYEEKTYTPPAYTPPVVPTFTPKSTSTGKNTGSGTGKNTGSGTGKNTGSGKDKAANDAKKAAEDAKRAEEERQRKELEALQAGLDARKKVLERYKAYIDVTDFGLEFIDADDFGLKGDLLSEKLDQLTAYGQKMRAEFERITSIIPTTGEQADALGNRLEELGSDMRNNVTEIRKTTIELQKLSIDMASTVVEDRIGELQSKLKSIDRQTELLNSGYKDDFDHLNDMLSFNSMLPSYSSFSKERAKSSSSNKDIIKSEQKTQDAINDIIEEQIKKNEKLREDERQAILADMETMRQDTLLKLETAQTDYEGHTATIKQETDNLVKNVTDLINNMELKFPKPDTTEFGKAADEVKKSLETVTKLLGVTPGAYATGTTKGNQQASTLGIAGENYKPEILIDKKTGQKTYIDSPTVIDTSKTDVVGEQATASLPKFAKGTVGDITSEPHGMSKLCEGLRNVAKYAKGYGAVYAARQFLGKPYVWGGTSEDGVDCSGLTYLAWKRMGVDIGRTTYVQYPNSTKISASELKPGDLVFSSFGARDNDGPGHVGMYVANGRTIESPRTGDVVKYSSIGKWTAYGRPKYASGTPDGNAQVKNLGLAGENYKPEILIDKNSGEMRYIDKPTVIDISKTDVIGEKATAKLPKFATGTPTTDSEILKLIKRASEETGVPANIIMAVMDHETGYKWYDKVPDGKGYSYGYMMLYDNGAIADIRLRKGSAAANKAKTDKYTNVYEGADLLKRLYASTGNWADAASAYNQGLGNLQKYGRNTYGNTVWENANKESFIKAAENIGAAVATGVSSGTSTETSKEKSESEKIGDKIDEAYEEVVSAIGRIESEKFKEIDAIKKNDGLDDIQKGRQTADILYEINRDASVEITKASNKLTEEFFQWLDDVEAGTKEWNYEIYMAYKEGIEKLEDTSFELAQNAWETKSEAADKDWEISSGWIEERNKKGDWNLFYDSEVEAWDRVITWLETNYKQETGKLKEAKDNKIEAEWNNSSNWIEERKEKGDWNLFNDSESQAWGRVIKWLEEKYPNEQAKIREANKNLVNAKWEEDNKWIEERNERGDWSHYGISEAEAWEEVIKWLKENYPDEQEKLREAIKKASDARWQHSNDWISERNQYNDWALFDDSEVEAWERVIRNLNRDEPDYISRLREAEKNLFEARKKEFSEANNYASTYIESQKTLLQAYYNVTNSVADAQHSINKELENSKTMYEYLDEDTRKLLFNQEDYNRLTEELLDIQAEANILQRQYEKDLRNSTAETVGQITADYERQYKTLMKSYELAKADLEIAKKKQKLNNVLNERNVRMFVNGSWQWVANAENVASAKTELADAEYSRGKTQTEMKQQESLDALAKRQENLNLVIKQFENGVISLAEAVGLARDSIGILPKSLRAIYKLAGVDTPNYTTGASSRSVDGTWYESNVDYSDRIANAKTFEEASQINPTRNTKISGDGLPYLPYIIPELGAGNEADILWNTTITEFGKDNEADMFWIRKYASGSKNTQGGIALMGEEGSETFITSKGRLIPITQPTVGNISSGGVVFNTDQMKNLRTLWDMSNLNLNPDRNYLSGLQPQQIDQRQDNRIIINGMTVDSGSVDGQALIGALRRYVGNH